jgi:signal transduction histidine kinase
MSDPVWYRSLYWRIAVGFVALLATLLIAQGLVFAWMTGRMTDVFPSRSPVQVAAAMAEDVADALADPAAPDIPAYLSSRYSGSFRGWVVALADGRVFESQRVPPPPTLDRTARARLSAESADLDPDRVRNRGRGGRGDGGRGDGGRGASARAGGAPDGRGWRSGFFGGRGGSSEPAVEYARIVLDGQVVGVVAVPVEAPPLSVTLRALGPTLAVVALALLAAGTAVAALVIARPTRRRLQQLQQAAVALGSGQPGVRAPESGGDEVTSLSRAFNTMASQLDSRAAALEQADRTRRQLLADVSHELMTPLSAIRGYVETLSMDDLRLDDAARSRYLGIVNEEAGRLEHIIGDLLDLARLEGGGGTFREERVSIDQLLERVRDRHGPILSEKAIALTTRRDPSVDGVRGDPNRLEQALQNLVANALRHTPPGGAVTVEATAVENGVTIAVQDTGPGIPLEHLPHLFDRFYKVDESRAGTDVPSGSGLGLSIVRAIVGRHGGTVTASNAPDGGARFEIVLPRFVAQ